MTAIKVVIIGFGASGIMSFYNLVCKKAKSVLEIDIFDDEFSGGIAYSTTNIHHLLNVRAINISAVYDDKNHFVEWLKKNNYQYGAQDFVPRAIYGLYLNFVAAEAFKMADENGIKFHVKKQKIDNIVAQNDEFIINDKAYQCAILAIGAQMGAQNFWKINLDQHLSDPQIHLLGAGLTAFDAVISIVDAGYKGLIYMHSRSNKLPQMHAQKFYDYSIKPVLTLQDGQLPLSLLFRKFTKICKNSDDWRFAFDSIRSITAQLWQNFDVQKKQRFMRHCFRLWNVHRHRCPQTQYKIISDLIKSGRLILTKEKIQSVKYKYIECLGFDFHVKNPLIEALLRNNIVTKDEMNLTIKSGFANFAIVGANNFGSMFETTAIGELREQAHCVAQAIVDICRV